MPAEEKKPVPAPKAKLARASESGDPAVHALLAHLQTARANGDDEQVEALTKQLADLGYQ